MNQNKSLQLAQKAFYSNEFLRTNDYLGTLSDKETLTNTQVSNCNIGSIKDIFDSVIGVAHLLTDLNIRLWMQQSSQGKREAMTALSTRAHPFETVYIAAFEELARVRADDRIFLKVLGELRNTKAIPENEALSDRLEELLHAYQEDYGQSLDAESLRTFISFVSRHPKLKRPIITATPDGNLYAEWKGDEGRRYLGVQFLPTRQVRYVGIRPNPEHLQSIRSSGLVTADQLLAEITSHNVADWAGRFE